MTVSFACTPDVARPARPTASSSLFAANSPASGPRDLNAPTSSDDRKLGVAVSALALATPRSSPIGNAIRTAAIMLGVVLEMVGPARAEPAAIARSTTSSPVQRFASFIAEASQRFAIPVSWIRAVMHVESAGRAHAVSPKGAMGLMQIMPKTYAGLRARYHLGSNPYDPRDNILAGTAYLREMHDRYGSPGFLAAYNAGPDRYDEHLATGRPLPIETQDYVAMLMPMIGDLRDGVTPAVSFDLLTWLRSALFVPHENAALVAVHAAVTVSPDRLPTLHRIVDLSALAPHSEGLFVRVADRNQSQ
jgi:soluble lytic murein transglycosylase-like protein